MTLALDHDLRRRITGKPGSGMSRLKHAAGISTIIVSFTFLFALVIGLIQ